MVRGDVDHRQFFRPVWTVNIYPVVTVAWLLTWLVLMAIAPVIVTVGVRCTVFVLRFCLSGAGLVIIWI